MKEMELAECVLVKTTLRSEMQKGQQRNYRKDYFCAMYEKHIYFSKRSSQLTK